MAETILTIQYHVDAACTFVSSVANSQLYLYVGNHVDSNSVAIPYDNPETTVLDAYYGMIFGKKITTSDVCSMINRYDWQANTVYDMYDHRDETLYEKEFYVVVEDGAQFDVFKCLENGGGAPSTVAPDRANVNADGNDFYYPTDGYRWKYMYSISESDAAKFGTDDYFPAVVDANTRSQATDGSIDVIIVTDAGAGYSNYLIGEFGVGDLRLNGDPRVYGISTTGVNTTNGFYDSCWMYITSGPGEGQYRKIESFASNSSYNFVTLETAFDPSDLPQNTSEFEIYPSVRITGDGEETDTATARAIIDPSGNTVSRVEILDRGAGYNLAAAEVLASNTVGITEDSGVVPIYSPPGGHGYDPRLELGAKFACVSVKLNS